MCHLFSHQPPERYEGQTRSIRIGGHSTSIRLEAAFWVILEELAADQGLSLGKFITTLHDEVLEVQGEISNFASLLRCSCLLHVSRASRLPLPEIMPVLIAAE